jgi:hypothetical protein
VAAIDALLGRLRREEAARAIPEPATAATPSEPAKFSEPVETGDKSPVAPPMSRP